MIPNELRDRTEAVLREFVPGLCAGIRHDREGTYLDLLPASDADYRFTLYIGEPQIHAELLPPSAARKFWYWPFAEQDYEDVADQEAHFLDCVRLLLQYPTRIIQRKTFLGAVFRCEADTDGGVEPIGGSLGVWFGVPRIADRRRVYRSPPVGSRSDIVR